MTVETNDTVDRWVISGTGPYVYSFRIFDESELSVCIDVGDLDPVPLTLETHYTVSGVDDEDGGTLTLDASIASEYASDTLDIRSLTAEYQPTSIRNQGRFLPEVHEDAFDRLNRQIQDLSRRVDRKFGYPDNTALEGGMVLRSSWADKWVYVNTDGEFEPASAINPQALTRSIIGALFQPQSDAEAAKSVVPTNYYEDYGYLERYGAAGDGTTDDTAAWRKALLVGGYVRGKPGKTYRITGSGYLTQSDTTIDMRGCIINQVTAATPALYIGRTISSSTFVQTERVQIVGGKYTGAVLGGGSPAYGITVIDPTTNPYVKGGGCNNIEIWGLTASGFTGGLLAAAATNVRVHDCELTGMLYHSALGAGGYGVLFQSCFDVSVQHNRFLAASTDRHGVYVSANPNRTADDNNTCKGVVISNNIFDWTGTAGVTGFEAPIEIRSSQRTVVTGNSIRGGYGGIEFDASNGNGSAIIANNEIKDTIAGVSSRSAIIIYRDSGSNLNRDMVVANNSIEFSHANVNGIYVGYCLGAVVSGNSLKIGSALDAIIFDTSSNIRVGANNINVTTSASSGVNFAGTCSDVTIGQNTFDGTITKRYRYTSAPSSMRVDFPRTVTVSWSGGVATVTDDDDLINAQASSANGFTVTFENWITDLSLANLLFSTSASNVCAMYRRTSAGQVLTVGVKDFAGVDLPAASNDYSVAITLKA